MNCSFIPSLEHIALVKITTTLWNQEDIILNCRTKWKEIERKIKKKVLLLPQPKYLKQKVLGAIKPIGLQISGWMEYNQRVSKITINLRDELIWTPQGTLNRKKTAEALMRDETIDINKRDRLAHIYCLESEIETLRGKMLENETGFNPNPKRPKRDVQHEVLHFWTNEIQTEKLTSYQFAFTRAALCDDQVSTEYFWNKLAPEERVKSMDVILRCWSGYCWRYDSWHFGVLHFLLSQADEELQMQIIAKHPIKVLLLFLEWPWQSLFMEIVNCAWEFLDDENYYQLLNKIVDKVGEGYKDYDYQKLFGEFWQKSGTARKTVILSRCATDMLLVDLFGIKDVKNISLILKEATAEEKENIVCHWGIYICRSLAQKNHWSLIQFFLTEFISSHERLIKFKDECKMEIALNFYYIRKLSRLVNCVIQKMSVKSKEEKECALRLSSSGNE